MEIFGTLAGYGAAGLFLFLYIRSVIARGKLELQNHELKREIAIMSAQLTISAKPTKKPSELLKKMKEGSLVFVFALLISAAGCETVRCNSDTSGMFPISNPGTGDELFLHCPPEKCPAVWAWVGRLATYKEQIEVGTKPKITVSTPEITP